jgi:hypothetical protein
MLPEFYVVATLRLPLSCWRCDMYHVLLGTVKDFLTISWCGRLNVNSASNPLVGAVYFRLLPHKTLKWIQSGLH